MPISTEVVSLPNTGGGQRASLLMMKSLAQNTTGTLTTTTKYVPAPSMGAKRLDRAGTCAVPLQATTVLAARPSPEQVAATAALVGSPLSKTATPASAIMSALVTTTRTEAAGAPLGWRPEAPDADATTADATGDPASLASVLRGILRRLPSEATGPQLEQGPDQREAIAAAVAVRRDAGAVAARVEAAARLLAATAAAASETSEALRRENAALRESAGRSADALAAAERRADALAAALRAERRSAGDAQRAFDERVRRIGVALHRATQRADRLSAEGALFSRSDRRPPSAPSAAAVFSSSSPPGGVALPPLQRANPTPMTDARGRAASPLRSATTEDGATEDVRASGAAQETPEPPEVDDPSASEMVEAFACEDASRLRTEIRGLHATIERLGRAEEEKTAAVAAAGRANAAAAASAAAASAAAVRNELLAAEVVALKATVARHAEEIRLVETEAVAAVARAAKTGGAKNREVIGKALQLLHGKSLVASYFSQWQVWLLTRRCRTLQAKITQRDGDLQRAARQAQEETAMLKFRCSQDIADAVDTADCQRVELASLRALVASLKEANRLGFAHVTAPPHLAGLLATPNNGAIAPLSPTTAALETSVCDAGSPVAASASGSAVGVPPERVGPRSRAASIALQRSLRGIGVGQPVLSEGTRKTEVVVGHLGECTILDLQTKALEVYNILLPVLNGVRLRLKLTIAIPPLRLVDSATINVVVLVLRWIEERYSFLNLMLTLDDRLLRVKGRLIFLAISLRPKVRTLEEQLGLTYDAPQRALLLRRINGFVDVMQKVTAVKARIDASRLSLRSCTDESTQKAIAALTKTFEAEYEEFGRLLKIGQSAQFQLMLQMTRLTQTKQAALHDDIARRAQRSAMERRGVISAESGFGRKAHEQRLKQMDRVWTPPQGGPPLAPRPSGGASGDPSPEAEVLKSRAASIVAAGALTANSAPRSKFPSNAALRGGDEQSQSSGSLAVALVPGARPADTHEASRHHMMYIGSVIPGDDLKRLRQDHFQRLLQSEFEASARRRKVAVSPELIDHRERMKKQAGDRSTDPNARRAFLVHGGLEHFVSHAGAVIPFRSNLSRSSLGKSSTTAKSTADAQPQSIAELLLDGPQANK